MVGGVSVTPIKRVPILANFEEWMKMATDNKINATNSWNFALIDYFHDMSLLKEGDGVNFQKASCTLDGCVKIYTNRVDSVATETGKLLSGLADSSNKKKGGRDGEDAEGEESEEELDEDGNPKKKTKKKVCRPSLCSLLSRDKGFFSSLSVSLTCAHLDTKVIRGDPCAILQRAAAEKIRARVHGGSSLQESFSRF
jgi:condensin complex subunit 2